jgi:hypothetical protein
LARSAELEVKVKVAVVANHDRFVVGVGVEQVVGLQERRDVEQLLRFAKRGFQVLPRRVLLDPA